MPSGIWFWGEVSFLLFWKQENWCLVHCLMCLRGRALPCNTAEKLSSQHPWLQGRHMPAPGGSLGPATGGAQCDRSWLEGPQPVSRSWWWHLQGKPSSCCDNPGEIILSSLCMGFPTSELSHELPGVQYTSSRKYLPQSEATCLLQKRKSKNYKAQGHDVPLSSPSETVETTTYPQQP